MIIFWDNFPKCCIHIDQDHDQSNVEIRFRHSSVEPDVNQPYHMQVFHEEECPHKAYSILYLLRIQSRKHLQNMSLTFILDAKQFAIQEAKKYHEECPQIIYAEFFFQIPCKPLEGRCQKVHAEGVVVLRYFSKYEGC